MLTRRLLAAAALALLLALAACSSGQPDGATAPPGSPVAALSPSASPPGAQATSSTPGALASPSPAVTGQAQATPTPGVLQIETATASPTPTETPPPTEPPPCVNNLAFVSDLTIPDGMQFLPGQPMDKQWRVRNTGECDWNSDYRLVLVSGSGMGPRSELALYPARAGAEATIQIVMQAPQEPGEYTGRWQARSPEGRLFGNVIFIKVVVIALPEPEEPPQDAD